MGTTVKLTMFDETGQLINQSLKNIVEKLNNHTGASSEQVAQIEKNKTDVVLLKNDIEKLKQEIDSVSVVSAKVDDSGNLIVVLSDTLIVSSFFFVVKS
jgi:DNA repair exonuclease SbcCD ATPase subunit